MVVLFFFLMIGDSSIFFDFPFKTKPRSGTYKPATFD